MFAWCMLGIGFSFALPSLMAGNAARKASYADESRSRQEEIQRFFLCSPALFYCYNYYMPIARINMQMFSWRLAMYTRGDLFYILLQFGGGGVFLGFFSVFSFFARGDLFYILLQFGGGGVFSGFFPFLCFLLFYCRIFHHFFFCH